MASHETTAGPHLTTVAIVDDDAVLQNLQQLLNDLRTILRQVGAKEISKQQAASRLEDLLGPPVRPDPIHADTAAAPAARAYEELVNGCRLTLDRLRAGLMGHDSAFEAVQARVSGTPYDDTSPDVHAMTLEPLPPPGKRRRPST